MERFTVKAGINGCYSQRPTFQTNVPISFPPKPHLKEPPFTSYLRPETLKPAVAEDTEISIFGAERYFNDGTGNRNNKKSVTPSRFGERCDLSSNPRDSSVSSVDEFGRNYRNRSFHATPTASSEASWNSQTGLLKNSPGSVAVTVRTLPSNEQRRESSSSCIWFFGRNCPCAGKKSVAVEEKFSEAKSPNHSNSDTIGPVNLWKQSTKAGEVGVAVVERAAPIRPEVGLQVKEMAKLKVVPGNWVKEQEVFCGSGRFSPAKHLPVEIGNRIVTSGRPFNGAGGFSFPVLNHPAEKLLNGGTQPDDPPRESLEVFRPPEDTVVLKKSTEFQRRMAMTSYTGDDGRRSFTFPVSPKARVQATEDDLASDSSSDLFEIESFSTQTTSCPMYRRRDSLDEMPGFDPRRFVGNAAGILQLRRGFDEPATPSTAPSECYAPSEVSVEWSVTTAEGFDRASLANFSSAASDYDDSRFIQPIQEKISTAISGGGGKRRGNGLLSCRWEKAVNVGPLPVKFGSEQQNSGGSFPADTGRALATARLGTGSSMHMPRVNDMCPLGRSNSARMTRPLPTR